MAWYFVKNRHNFTFTFHYLASSLKWPKQIDFDKNVCWKAPTKFKTLSPIKPLSNVALKIKPIKLTHGDSSKLESLHIKYKVKLISSLCKATVKINQTEPNKI
jgi:hypothetical protein